MSVQFCKKMFLAFNICWFCVVIRFFHPGYNDQWPPTSKDFYPRFYSLHFLTILVLEKEPVFPFFNVECQTREQFNNVFGMTRFLTGDWTWDRTRCQYSTTRLSRRQWLGIEPGTTLDASTLPLGYRGGSDWGLNPGPHSMPALYH